MAPRHNHVPKEEWEARKGLIYKLYLEQEMTCSEVRDHMSQYHNFHATIRMYKGRFREWKFPHKKTEMSLYGAMRLILEERRLRHIDTVFDVPTGTHRQLKKPEQIYKELNRATQKPNMSLSSAYALLRKYDIRILAPPVEKDREGNFVSLQPPSLSMGESRHRAGSGTHDSISSGDFSLPSEDGDLEGLASSSSTDSSDDESTSTLPCVPANEGTARTREYSLPGLQELGLASANDSPRLRPTTGSLPGQQDFDRSGRLHQKPPYSAYTNQEADSDFDFTSTFAQLSLDSTLDGLDGSPIPLQLSGDKPGKLITGRWAAPYFLNCFSNNNNNNNNNNNRDHANHHHSNSYDERISSGDGGSGKVVLQKLKAMEILRYLLKQDADNQFIFPCLNWMSTVLSSTENWPALRAFLEESCAVIDDEMGENFTYGSPFHYALAVCMDDREAQRKYGAQFAKSHSLVKMIYKTDSPNVLISLYYWAWHLLHNKEFEAVFRVLNECLPASERIMGRRDLITINCMSMLSRAYDETGDHDRAIQHLQDALDRLADPPIPLRAFRLLLLWRLSKLQISVGRHEEAESNLREIVDGRIQILGWRSTETWGAINDLCNVIRYRGRIQEADQLRRDMTKQHNWAWFQSNGYSVPPQYL